MLLDRMSRVLEERRQLGGGPGLRGKRKGEEGLLSCQCQGEGADRRTACDKLKYGKCYPLKET